jgi:hypothetical protein
MPFGDLFKNYFIFRFEREPGKTIEKFSDLGFVASVPELTNCLNAFYQH